VIRSAGLRRGEILSLKWTDYEPTLRRLWIRRALIETKVEGVLIKETKSERVRSITLPRMAMEALEIHRIEQGKRRELLTDEYRPGDWVCCVEDGSLWHPSAFTSAYRALLARRKLKGLTSTRYATATPARC
jgi:integrase